MTPGEIMEKLQRIVYLASEEVTAPRNVLFIDEETGESFTVDRVELKDGEVRLISEAEEDDDRSDFPVVDMMTEVVNLVGPENYREPLHLEDADGNITMATSVTLSNGKVTLHHSGE